jgi:hypothetical protein
MSGPTHFLDQIDADIQAHRWLNERAVALGADHIDWFNHEDACGRTGIAWKKRQMVAVAVVARDRLNHSVLSCHEVPQGP